jgi:hypothetical protein
MYEKMGARFKLPPIPVTIFLIRGKKLPYCKNFDSDDWVLRIEESPLLCMYIS